MVPSAIFGWWSYSNGVEREFSEVKDRHLLIAQNLGRALERYHTDVVASFDAISTSLMSGRSLPGIENLMSRLHMRCVSIIDASSGRFIERVSADQAVVPSFVGTAKLGIFKAIAKRPGTNFSVVMPGPDGENSIYVVRRFDKKLAVSRLDTSYFVSLGKSISFGIKGHAAIVDQAGNVLAHPLSDWVAQRKNIAKVSAVRRMMNGETGIQQFYSPALKGDMIAGLTAVAGTGWGVMIPQPVSELYDKVYKNNVSIFTALGVGLSITFVFVFILINLLAAPLERIVAEIKLNAKNHRLERTKFQWGMVSIQELVEFQCNYNDMVQKVTIASKQIKKLAYKDTVTGLPNREKFQKITDRALEDSKKNGSSGILVLIDLDNFKEINDIHGHDTGDEFLRACAAKLVKITDRLQIDAAGEPTVARIGGDEFTILVPGLNKKGEIKRFLHDLCQEMATPCEQMAFVSECSASIGCARYPADALATRELIKRADMAMYEAKKDGKNKARIFGPGISTKTVAEIRRDVLLAIKNDELVLEYQPKVCAKRREIAGVEALVRWQHPKLGRLPPDKWIPAISGSSVIEKLGEWVANQAMVDHEKMTATGHDLHLSINIGSRHFISPGFVETLARATKRHGFDNAKLDIEVTEDALFSSHQRAASVINRLHELGFTISIDDFGKGYSNITRLAQLPIDYLKIDKTIIIGAQEDPRIKSVLASTIEMAKNLDCKTVGEGIETLQHAEFVSSMGVNLLQGFYFARALPLDELISWMEMPRKNTVHSYQKTLKTSVA